MDYYHGWFDLKPSVKDMSHLQGKKLIEGWRLARRKLGLAPSEIGEFHLMIETKNLAQLDEAFNHVASRSEPVESLHFEVNSKVQNLRFGLYRDFPDAVRQEGQERF